MKSKLLNVYGLVGTAGLCLLLASGANAANPPKIDICHAPPDNPANTQLIQVGLIGGAAYDHMSHGDWLVTGARCDAIVDNDCDGIPDDTALDDADCEAQLGAGALCDAGECIRPACFSFTNTAAEDLVGGAVGAGWFDACVDGQTTQVRVTLRDLTDTIVYQATGTKDGVWNFDHLTSTRNPISQWDTLEHDRIITLDNGDLLRISGKSGRNAGCAGGLGNGYVIMIYEALPSAAKTDIKMLVAPYTRTELTNGAGARFFRGWTPEHEISWKGGVSDMDTCENSPLLVPFQGTFEFEVF